MKAKGRRKREGGHRVDDLPAEPPLAVVGETEKDRAWRKETRSALLMVQGAAGRLVHLMEEAQGIPRYLSAALDSLAKVAERCPTCGVRDDAHKGEYPCDVWDLLDLFFDGFATVRPGDVLQEHHFTVLRKLWALRPDRYPPGAIWGNSHDDEAPEIS